MYADLTPTFVSDPQLKRSVRYSQITTEKQQENKNEAFSINKMKSKILREY